MNSPHTPANRPAKSPLEVVAQLRHDACAIGLRVWRGENVYAVHTVWRGKVVKHELSGYELIQAMNKAANEIEWRHMLACVNKDVAPAHERELITA